jgi:hypothetical protein
MDSQSIAETHDLFVSPAREDGITYGTPTQTSALVVSGTVYVHAANGQESRWYRGAVSQKAGRVRGADTHHDVTSKAAGTTDEDAIDAAYEAEYRGSSAVPNMPRSPRTWPSSETSRTTLNWKSPSPTSWASSRPSPVCLQKRLVGVRTPRAGGRPRRRWPDGASSRPGR